MSEPISPLTGESYDEYIQRILSLRPNKKVDKSQQKHHIIPKSRGGTDDSDNLIWLYKSEHVRAHYLYSQEHPHDSRMAFAAHAMSRKDDSLLTDNEINQIAIRNSQLQSERVKGDKNPMWNKHHTEESRRKNSEKHIGKNTRPANNMYGVHRFGEDAFRYGHPATPEQKKKQSIAMTGKMVGEKNPRAVKVKCIETRQVFNTLKEAAEWCGLKHPSDISHHIDGKKYSAGKHPETKAKLHWAYIE